MEIEKRRIAELFTKTGDLIIPRNQREFTWGGKQWKDLIYDVECNIDRTKEVFIGSLIFLKKTMSSDELFIIDGQQRLTSILILLSTIHRLFIEYNEISFADGVSQYLLRKKVDGELVIRISNSSSSTLKYVVYNYSVSNKEKSMSLSDAMISDAFICEKNDKFIECFSFFYNTLKSKVDSEANRIEILNKFRDSVLSFFVSEIIVSDEVDAYEVFEVLNARGKPLEQYELLKNFIYRYFPSKGGVDIAKDRWENIYNKIVNAKINFGMFLKHYVTHKGGKDEDSGVYDSIKSFYPNRNVNDLLTELELCADIYLVISDKANDDIKNNFCLNKQIVYDLNILNRVITAQIKPILMSLFRGYKDNESFFTLKELQYSISNLKKFMCRYVLIQQTTTNTLENHIYSFSNKIYCDEKKSSRVSLQEFWSELLIKEDPSISFKDQFKKLGYTKQKRKIENARLSQKTCKIVLEEYDLYYSKDFGKKSDFTIEHIKDDVIGGKSYQIGNMIPLTNRDNKECNGKDFINKVEIYKSSNFKTTLLFSSKYRNWDDDMIETRTIELANDFDEKIWKLPKKIMSIK